MRTGLPTKLVRASAAFVMVVALAGVAVSIDAHPARASTIGDQIVAEAASQAGVPYCDGGGGINGPTTGDQVEAGCGAGVKGFDCMSLVQYAVYQATGIILPDNGTQPEGVGTYIPPAATLAEDEAQLQPGDAVYWGGGGIDSFAHSGIYAGNDEVWDAVSVDIPVQTHTMEYLRNIYNYDGAEQYTSSTTTTAGGLVPPVVGMASTPDGAGYWLAASNGGVSVHGDANFYGSMAGHALNAPIAHIVATPDGHGYWLVAADGGIFTFGDAPFFGSMGGQHLNAPVVDLAPTPDGGGYWLVAADGGIFSFGDAAFHGSMGGQHLNAPVVGMAADRATGGYWEVASDGGIFSFGATFFGSTGNIRLNQPINGMAPTEDGGGYWFVASDGGVFSFGDATFLGSMGGSRLNAPVVGMASDPANPGYWLVGSDGGIFSFGGAGYFGEG